MRIRFNIGTNLPFTTVGYWAFDGLCNTGTLQIYCWPLSKKRYRVAVIGHELIEAFYCWCFHITTEECDRWDSKFEQWYKDGRASIEQEPGDAPDCPYHRGHWLGCLWERVCITLTFAGWREYVAECNSIYHKMNSQPRVSSKTIP